MKPDGFDLGNSPSEYAAGPPLGETLVLATTNGTRAIVAAAPDADAVLIGSLSNLTACAAAAARLARDGERDMLIQCAGVEGEFALDDAYTAGRFVAELRVWLAEWGRATPRGGGGDGCGLPVVGRRARGLDERGKAARRGTRRGPAGLRAREHGRRRAPRRGRRHRRRAHNPLSSRMWKAAWKLAPGTDFPASDHPPGGRQFRRHTDAVEATARGVFQWFAGCLTAKSRGRTKTVLGARVGAGPRGPVRGRGCHGLVRRDLCDDAGRRRLFIVRADPRRTLKRVRRRGLLGSARRAAQRAVGTMGNLRPRGRRRTR